MSRLRIAVLAAAGAASLAGCSMYDDGYGYGGMSVGYGAGYGYDGYGCDPYWDDCYGAAGYGYGYGDPWYGWYNDYYYPGTGYYIYDRGGRRYRWNDDVRRYWENRRERWGNRNWNDRRWERWDGYRNRDNNNFGNRVGQAWGGRGNGDAARRRDWDENRGQMYRRDEAMGQQRERYQQRQERAQERMERRQERSESRRSSRGESIGSRWPRRQKD